MKAEPRILTAAGLVAAWREQATQYDRDGVTTAARILERVADELEAVQTTAGDALLSLNEAARLSGYAPDTLGRMLRDGRLPNHGRRNAPRVRLADLPLRSSTRGVTSATRHRSAGSEEGTSDDTNDQKGAA